MLSVLSFLLVVPIALACLLYYLYEKYPKQPDLQQLMSGMQFMQPPDEMPSWRRWLQPPPRPQSRQRQGGRGGAASRADHHSPAGPGTVGGGMSSEQLALRELAESQFILIHQGERTEPDALATFRASSTRGTVRTYEEKRLLSRMLLMRFAKDDYNPVILQDFRDAAVEIAQMPLAGFEEFYYAGVATLFNGEDQLARDFLAQALDVWPARGLGFGNVYMFMLIAKGVEPDPPTFFRMLNDFQRTYPNWMYVETYMKDIEYLEGVYPNSPLIRVMRGYCYSLVLNDAAAQEAYREAARMPNLNFLGRRTIERWLNEIEEIRQP